MSPASQGSLEVERFIGSNLISSWARVSNNNRNNGKGRKQEGKPVKAALQRSGVNNNNNNGIGGEQYNRHVVRPGYQNILPPCDCTGNYGGIPARTQNWTGMPLISGKKKNQQFHRNVLVEDESSLRTPLSRLAIHTQGAPLILAGRCNASRKNQNRGASTRGPRSELSVRRSNKYKDGHPHGLNGTSDCLSVASDESSGSSHSENCLPRIIKPRKRRKKDRKPVASGDVPAKNDAAKPAEAPTEKTCDTKPNQESKISSGSHVDEVSEDELHCPKLHHSFEDVAESESYVYSASSCQCHYCDPSGIWGANFFPKKEGLSFLTPPPDSMSKSFHYYNHSDLILRRSWSEPIQSQTKVSTAEDRGTAPQRSNSFSLADSWKSKTWEDAHRWEGTFGKASKGKEVRGYGSQCLEVSTEIVTSPNGHRDIEIRFYSTSPPV